MKKSPFSYSPGSVYRDLDPISRAERGQNLSMGETPKVKGTMEFEFELRSLRGKLDAEKLLRKRDQDRIEELEKNPIKVKELVDLVRELQETCKVLRFLRFDVDGLLYVHQGEYLNRIKELEEEVILNEIAARMIDAIDDALPDRPSSMSILEYVTELKAAHQIWAILEKEKQDALAAEIAIEEAAKVEDGER